MLDTLIKFLGGFPRHEMEKMSLTCDAWRTRAIAAETTVELVKEIMTRERDRAERLEKKLEDVPTSEPDPRGAPSFNPIGDRRVSSWPRIRRELEKQNRVKQDAQVSREEIEKTIREG